MNKITKVVKESLDLKCMLFIVILIIAVLLWAFFLSLFKDISFILRALILIPGISLIAYFSHIVLKNFMISPIQSIEKAARSIADSNFSLRLNIKTDDEIGRLGNAFDESVSFIEKIFQRVKNGSIRVSEVSKKVDEELKNFSESTKLEAEAIANIAISLEQMNSASMEISNNTESLATLTEENAASLEEMVSSISQVANSAQDLSNTVDSTSASIEELSSTIKEVANKAEDLAAASEETLTATEEIFFSIKEVGQSAKDSAMLSGKVKVDASTFGIASVEKTIEGIQNIKESFEKTANFIKKLSSRSEEIGKILNVIDDITDQTTLLALNAAILAAQAGEHGKGFSVVADEIKDLAERTSLSTREIAELIRAVQKEVKDATSAMDEGLISVEEGLKVARYAGDALGKIVESSRQSAEMSLSIERSTTEQAKTTKLVSDAIEKVKNMVAQVAKATSEQSKGARLITKATEKMTDVANNVKYATGEQLINIKQISESIENVSDKSRHIARALNEQRSGSKQIFDSVEKIKDIPKNTMDTVLQINQSLKGLLSSTELLTKDIEMIKFSEKHSNDVLDVIRFGVEPLGISPVEVFEKFSPFADFLSNKVGKKIEIRVASDYKGIIKDIGQGTTQICFMTPTTYIEANKKYGVEVIAKGLIDGKPVQRSVIISKNNSKIKSVGDIKGCKFAFADAHSLYSFIAPRIMLIEAGIDLKDLLHYEYLGSQENVVEAVLKGNFDAGAVSENTAYKYKEKGVNLIKFSEAIPGFTICASKLLPEKYKASVKKALIELTNKTDEGSFILDSIPGHYTAFVEASDPDYASIKAMMKRLNMI